jgi:hypothetical protein
MRRVLDQTEVLKEFAAVGDKLAAGGLTGEKRLALLRRQAQLGDLRDALAQRTRRADAEAIAPPEAQDGSR